MNYLKVVAALTFPEHKPSSAVNFVSESISIQIMCKDKAYELYLSSTREIKVIIKKFDDVYNLLFIVLGYFPLIKLYQENGIDRDLKLLLVKYKTSQHFVKHYSILCKIDIQNINEDVLLKFIDFVHRKTIISLEYLACTEYEHLVSEHKMVLLLHTIDGFIKNSYIEKELKNEVQRERGSKGRVFYKKRVTKVFDTFFFIHNKYNCEIFELLNANEKKFVDTVSDTRDGLSHLIDMPELLSDGVMMHWYFYITLFTLRIFILNEIGIPLEDDYIKEYIYVLHDWIAEYKLGEKAILKSITYNQSKSISELVNMFEKIQRDKSTI